MAKNNTGKIVGVVAVLAIIALLIVVVPKMDFTGSDGVIKQSECADSTGILTVNELSAIAGGTAPTSATITAGVNGGAISTSVTSGTTTFPVGSEVVVLVSDTDSIDKSFKFVMPCGGKTLDAKLFYSSSDNPSIEWQDKNSNTLSDAIAGGATNISDVTAGGVMKVKLILTGTSLESSGDGIIVLEFPAGSEANISSVTLGSLTQVTVPKVYTKLTAAGKVVAFAVPAVIGGTEAEYALNVQLESAKDLAGGVYTDWFGGQEFIDDDLITIGSGVEDSDGTAKYENTIDYDFFIN